MYGCPFDTAPPDALPNKPLKKLPPPPVIALSAICLFRLVFCFLIKLSFSASLLTISPNNIFYIPSNAILSILLEIILINICCANFLNVSFNSFPNTIDSAIDFETLPTPDLI